MPRSFGLPALFLLVCLAGGWVAKPAHASLAASPSASIATRTVEGRVLRLDSRLDPRGYPVTDVTLDDGSRFTILGGPKDGLRWVVDEEAPFAIGDRVRVRLEDGANGPRPAGGREGVEFLDDALPSGAAEIPSLDAPSVSSVTPSAGGAVADENLEVVVRGQRFGEDQGTSGVFFQGLFVHVPADVISWSDTLVRCLVPRPGILGTPQVLTGSVKIWTPAGGWSDGAEWDGGAVYHVLFQYAGDSWAEHNLPIPYFINPSGFPWPADEVVHFITEAAEVWHRAPYAYGRFRYDGYTDRVAVRDKDSVNVVGWTMPWPHNPQWLAVTWSGIDSATGERREVDVEINGERAWSLSERPDPGTFDLRTTMAHEFGHWMRLGHVQEPEHLMLAFQVEDETRRALAQGDREGAAWVYPTFGSAQLSRDTVYVGEDGSDPLSLDVTIADRRGRPVAESGPGDVVAIADWVASASAGSGAPAPAGVLQPDGELDAQGRTRFSISRIHGYGLLRFTVIGFSRSVRDRPVVTVLSRYPMPPGTWSLSTAMPNPVVSGSVAFTVSLGSRVRRLTANLVDARGRLVRVLADGPGAPGEQRLVWNLAGASPVQPGLYFLDVRADGDRQIRKVVVLGN